MKKKRERLMKRNGGLDILAGQADYLPSGTQDQSFFNQTANSETFSHINNVLQRSPVMTSIHSKVSNPP